MKSLRVVLVVSVLLGIVAGIVYGPNIQRLYYTLTLFDEDKIVSNFSSMRDMYPTVEIKPTSEPHAFDRQEQALPAFYEYQGQQKSTKDFLEKTSTTALLVLKDNTISYERYYQNTEADDYRISWSTAKSFLSALFGIAVAEGHIKSIETAVTDYVPELIGSGYDNVSIKDVLQMSSGVRFNEDYMDFNSDINRFGRVFALGGAIDEFAATLVSERPPGTFMHYVSIDTHVLGMVLRAATGKPIAEYFQEKIWSRIQPESSVYYVVDNANEPMVLGGMNLRTRDFARFGRLYLNQGRWNDQQVIPEAWVQQSVTPDAPHLMPGKRDTSDIDLGYGYQWWLPVDADQEFMALGVYGQFVYVNQKAGVVIVKNSANIHFADNNYESATETVAFFRAVVQSL